MPIVDKAQRAAYNAAYRAVNAWRGAEWARNTIRARRAAGLCTSCRTPVEKFSKCLDCRNARSEYYRTVVRPALMLESARCRDCRRQCVRPGAKRCGECSARYANAVRWGKAVA